MKVNITSPNLRIATPGNVSGLVIVFLVFPVFRSRGKWGIPGLGQRPDASRLEKEAISEFALPGTKTLFARVVKKFLLFTNQVPFQMELYTGLSKRNGAKLRESFCPAAASHSLAKRSFFSAQACNLKRNFYNPDIYSAPSSPGKLCK